MEDYFGDWFKCFNKNILLSTLNKVNTEYSRKECTPSKSNIFRAFKECQYNNLKVVILGQDPYPQKGIATGIAFANEHNENSPSLQVIKESLLDNPCKSFDNSLLSWEKQGILLLNSSLSVEVNNPLSHTNIWRPFIADFFKNLSLWNTGIIYLLMGKQAQSFTSFIGPFNTVLTCEHPSYLARMNKTLDKEIFNKISKLSYNINGCPIYWTK